MAIKYNGYDYLKIFIKHLRKGSHFLEIFFWGVLEEISNKGDIL